MLTKPRGARLTLIVLSLALSTFLIWLQFQPGSDMFRHLKPGETVYVEGPIPLRDLTDFLPQVKKHNEGDAKLLDGFWKLLKSENVKYAQIEE